MAVDVTELRARLTPLRERYRLELIILFGSAAKGLQRPQSDLDLAVLSEQPMGIVAVTTDMIRVLHINRVDVVDLRRAPPLLAMEVARDGYLLYERHAGQYAGFSIACFRRYVDTAKLRRVRKDAIHSIWRTPGSSDWTAVRGLGWLVPIQMSSAAS